MDFHTFATILSRHAMVTLGTALALYADLDLGKPVPTLNPVTGRHEYTHDALVTMAMNNDTVMHFMRNTQKIQAIKELRTLTNCSLKAAKDAVEDRRIELAVNPPF